MELERLSPQQFERFRTFIYRKCGIRIDEKKVSLLSNRIRRRLKAGSFADFDVYYRHITSPAGAGELESFLDVITTNETYFFRTAKHFEWLKQEFISKLVAQRRAGQRPAQVRIWSAGCASGAEAYSIAICMAENLYRLRDWKITILGTDISETVVRAAREGVFKTRALEAVTDKQRRSYFVHDPPSDSWQVRPELRKLVEFQRHNLIESPPPMSFDCIFICNVLIYFDRDSKQTVIKNLLQSLDRGGYMVVGPSEGVYDMLQPLRKLSTFLYQKPDGAGDVGNAPRGGVP